MKTTKLVLALAVSILSYSTTMAQESDSLRVDKKSDKIEQTYTCSMHPEVISDKPGKCPKCGMDLVVKGSASSDHKMGCMSTGGKKMYVGAVIMIAMMVVFMAVRFT